MARVSLEIVEILRKTADAIIRSNHYQWGHMGSCNCGFLAQQITALRKEEIHLRAMVGYGTWTEQLNDYCPTSGLPMDNLISEMIAYGFDTDDLKNLESLSNKQVLMILPVSDLPLKHNVKEDVVKYLHAWASFIENELIDQIELPEFNRRQSIL